MNKKFIVETISNKNDEYYTPPYAIKPILEFLEPESKIWCPFDTDDSYYGKILLDEGHTVITSHIDDGGNFFDINNDFPKRYQIDYIISNPPYSLKNEVFTKLFNMDTPFAMLVGVVGLFESKTRFNLFSQNDFEILYFDKRIQFMDDIHSDVTTKSPPFSSVYLCRDILPKQICFKELNKPRLKKII